MTDTEKLAIAIQALRDVTDPIAWVTREHPDLIRTEPEAVRMLAFRPFTSIGIARGALRAIGEAVDG